MMELGKEKEEKVKIFLRKPFYACELHCHTQLIGKKEKKHSHAWFAMKGGAWYAPAFPEQYPLIPLT